MIDYFASLDIFGWLEIAAMIVGFIYVYYQTRKSRLMWYFWFLTAVLNIFVYGHSHYTSMMLIQFYYLISAVYGIREWSKVKSEAIEQHGEDDRRHGSLKIAVKRFDKRKGIVSTLIAVAVFFVLAPVFNHFAGTDALFEGQPYFDTAIAVLSMLATYWLSQSYKEQWYIWLGVNLISIPIYLAGGLYWIVTLYIAYFVMSIIGLYQWSRHGVIVD